MGWYCPGPRSDHVFHSHVTSSNNPVAVAFFIFAEFGIVENGYPHTPDGARKDGFQVKKLPGIWLRQWLLQWVWTAGDLRTCRYIGFAARRCNRQRGSDQTRSPVSSALVVMRLPPVPGHYREQGCWPGKPRARTAAPSGWPGQWIQSGSALRHHHSLSASAYYKATFGIGIV